MSLRQPLDEIVHRIYAAVGDPTKWSALLETLAGALGVDVGRLLESDPERLGESGADEMVALVAAHLRRARALSDRIGELQIDCDAKAAMLDRIPLGLVIVDADRRIRTMNRFARRILEQREGFIADGGTLRALRPHEDRLLQDLVADVTRAGRDARSVEKRLVRVSRSADARPFAVQVSALVAAGSEERREQVAALVVVADPDQPTQACESTLAALYRLTPSEARVAGLLAQGSRIEEIAEQCEVSINTTRTHLNRIFGKTGTRTQAGLLRLILMGPMLMGSGLDLF